MMRKTQMRLLEILDIFHSICKKHDIDYWIDWGTLLGARRHAGFIPWDDDLDVSILQKDYKRLLSALRKELPSHLIVQTRKTDRKYWYYYPRIRDTKSRFHNKRGDIFEYNGIFFDIFLLEPVPSMKFKRFIDYSLLSEVNYRRANTLYQKFKYGFIMCFKPLVHTVIFAVRTYYKVAGHGNMFAYTFGANNYTKYNYANFFPLKEIIFEGKEYNAPGNIHEYLTDQFGSTYMQLPEASNRYSHALKVEFF